MSSDFYELDSYQELLSRTVLYSLLSMSIIDVHNESIHFILHIFADVKRDLFSLVVKVTIRKMK